MYANHSLIILKTYFSVFLKYFSQDKKYEYFIVFLNENERMSHLWYKTLVTILKAKSKKMTAKDMLPLLLQTEARLKLQGSSENSESHATSYAAKRGLLQRRVE
jgi:hypothetical protein